LNSHDQAMLAFVKTWHPYGGADEEIFPEFGISVLSFYRRVLALLRRSIATQIEAAESEALQAFCMFKLRQHGCATESTSVPRQLPARRSVRHI